MGEAMSGGLRLHYRGDRKIWTNELALTWLTWSRSLLSTICSSGAPH